MADLNPGGQDIILSGAKTPVADNDVANKAYVDDNGGTEYTAGTGIDISDSDVISAPLADINGPGIVPALPSDLNVNIETEILRSDGTWQNDGSRWTMSDNTIVRSYGSTNTYDNIRPSTDGSIQFGYNATQDDIAISIASGGVTSGKLADNAVTNAKIADNAVDTAEIMDAAVSTNKLTGQAVTAAKIANNTITAAQVADNTLTALQLATDSVTSFKIVDNAVTADELNVSGDGTSGQVLSSDGDGSFSWIDESGGGNVTDWNNANFGNFDTDGTINWSYNSTDDPSTSGEVSVTDDGVAGHTLRFRTEDVDTINSVSVNYFQIGFGSPIAFATYAVADLTIADDFVDVSLIDGPLDGDDLLASLPDDNTALTIIVSVSQFRLGIDNLTDVDTVTNAPVDNDILTWNATNSAWEPERSQVASVVGGSHIDVFSSGSVFTVDFNEVFDLWNGTTDWTQINTGTPTGTNILWDTATNTLTVPSLGLDDDDDTRTVLDILLTARSGMAVHIRQENTTSDPSGFQSGFYQILDIDAKADPDEVTIQLLADDSDIFNETAGNTYTYELSILQFVTGGTLNNLTLDGLADVDVTTPPTDGQVLAWDDTNSVYSPVDQSGGGQSDTDYNNAALGNIDEDGTISWTYSTADNPSTEGQVVISDEGTEGYVVQFRTEDIDTVNSVSVRLFQIGYGSPISFATYAVSDLTISDDFVDVSLIDGPLDGDDILATLPADATSLSISVSVNEFRLPLGELSDVSATAATDNQVLTWNDTNSEWEPQASQSGGATTLNGLNDVNTNGVSDGFLIRYDGDNSNYRAHSVENTVAVYGGLLSNRDGTLVTPVASGLNSLALGNDTEATGEDSIAIGIQAEGTAESAIAIGAGATATEASTLSIGELTSADHANSTAIGEGAGTENDNELRLGSFGTHVTVPLSVAGNESEENQLVTKRWVNNQIGDASRVISSTANAIENLATTTASTPWGDYRLVPGTALVPEMEVHMYEFDATQSQFIFYPGFMSQVASGDGTNLSTGDLPDFFEEVTDIGNESEVTDAAGEAVTSLGWKYIGHDTAVVWQAVSHVYTFDFEWQYPAANADGAQNPPDVTSSIELVRLKPQSDDTYSMNTNVTVIASSPTSFYNAGTLNPGDTEAFTGSYEFPQQLLADGLSNVQNDDVFAYRMKIRYKGDGFDGDTNVRLNIVESETENFVPQLGIRHVSRDYSLTVEDSGDVQWEDHNLTLDTLLLVDNSGDDPVIPTASLALTGGDGINIDGDDIDAVAAASGGLVVGGGGIAINTLPISGLSLTASGVAVNPGNGLSLNASDQVQVNLNATNSSLTADANGLAVTVATNGGLGYDASGNIHILTDPLISGPLSLSADGLAWSSDLSGISDVSTTAATDAQVLTWDGTNSEWAPADAAAGAGAIDGLSDVTITTPTDGQVLEFDSATSMWVNSSIAGGGSFTAGTGLTLTSESVLNLTASIKDLTDTYDTGNPADGDVLTFDSTQDEWTFAASSGSNPFFDYFASSETTNADASATNALAIGDTSAAGAANAIAIGADSTADGANAVVLGSNASSTSLGANGVAVGRSADVTGSSGVAIGLNTTASALNTVALGIGATASGAESISIGDTSTATATGSVALGNGADSTSTGTISIGDDSRANSAGGIAIGDTAASTSTGAIAVGLGNTAGGTNSVAIGNSAGTAAARSVAIGSDPSTGTSALGIAIGERALVSATRGIAIGSSTDSSASDADRVTASGTNAIAIGRGVEASGASAIAIGDAATASSSSSIALGNGAIANGTNRAVFGTGAFYRTFTGTRELFPQVTSENDDSSISGTVSSAFWNGGGFTSNSTGNEELNFIETDDYVSGHFNFTVAGASSTNFQTSDRWVVTSSSAPMIAAFGFATPDYRLSLGTVSIDAASSAAGALGQFHLLPGTSASSVQLGFRIYHVWGSVPRDGNISCNFSLLKR